MNTLRRSANLTRMAHFTHDDIVRLSPQERIELIGELWDSIGERDVPLPPAEAAELRRRLESFDEDERQAVGWETFKDQLSSPRP